MDSPSAILRFALIKLIEGYLRLLKGEPWGRGSIAGSTSRIDDITLVMNRFCVT